MKPKIIFLTFLIASILTACEKSDLQYENEFERSHKAWLEFKSMSGDTYCYKVTGSTWTGSSWLTTIYVRQGQVVQRNFCYTIFNNVQRPTRGWNLADADELIQHTGMTQEEFLENFGYPFHEALEWVETEKSLGTKGYSPASPLYTMDDIYALAKSDWLKKRADAQVIFETNNNGMISAVGYVPDGCADDCFNGMHIESIEYLY